MAAVNHNILDFSGGRTLTGITGHDGEGGNDVNHRHGPAMTRFIGFATGADTLRGGAGDDYVSCGLRVTAMTGLTAARTPAAIPFCDDQHHRGHRPTFTVSTIASRHADSRRRRPATGQHRTIQVSVSSGRLGPAWIEIRGHSGPSISASSRRNTVKHEQTPLGGTAAARRITITVIWRYPDNDRSDASGSTSGHRVLVSKRRARATDYVHLGVAATD